MGRGFLHRSYTEPRHLCSLNGRCGVRGVLTSMLFGYLNSIKIVKGNIWSYKRNAPTKSKTREEPGTDVSRPRSGLNAFHPEFSNIWGSVAFTTTVTLSRITLASGVYWMRSNRKGVSGVPEATTVKLLGVALGALGKVLLDEQSTTLFWPRPSSFSSEIKGFPSRKQVQEGLPEGGKLPTTDTPVPRDRIKPYKRL